MLKKALGASLLFASATSFAALDYLTVDNVYTVKGFDSNDQTQIAVSGWLPNLCFSGPKAKAKVFGEKIIVDVFGHKNDDAQVLCLDVAVPFFEVVEIGYLEKGEYSVVVNPQTDSEKTDLLTVVESSSSSVDDFYYANVDSVRQEGKNIIMEGYTPSDCFELKEIDFVSNDKDSFAVLPKMEKVADTCPMKLTPFKYEAKVPAELDAEKILIHVRVMNGKSVNMLFDKNKM